MDIKKLILNDFRNYENETLTFTDGVNIIYGNNGMGKTNALEAIYYFSQGRGFRGSGKDAVRSGCESGKIGLTFQSEQREYNGEIRFEGKQKKILLNEIELKKTSQLIGRFICVLFTPDEMNLVKGAPEVRRRFLDSAIIPMKPSYLSALMSYNLILKQKSSLLRQEKYSMLPIFNQQLAEAGSKIILVRRNYIEKIKNVAADIQSEISSGSEKLEISYNSSVKLGNGLSETKENFLKKLREMEESEKENKICFVGPHRDDISFKINGKSAKNFASQGQQRSIVLCLKTAQTELIREETGESPVMLLDDIMSELDKNRRDFLREKINGKQVIITCTEPENSDIKDCENKIHIKDGRVI
ncbi:MAG: DNA replication/repair protein RecF [Clostridia bacterium]